MRLIILLSTLVIVNKASITRSPYIVAILDKRNLICSGAIIHNQFILTSASCVAGAKRSDVSIRAGTETYNTDGVEAKIEKIIFHSKYNETTLECDLALLMIKGCLAIPTSNMKATTISDKHILAKKGIVSGWVFNQTSLMNPLNHYEVDIRSGEECERLTGENQTAKMLCASKTNQEHCVDLSAGSLLIAEGRLIGITSSRLRCDLQADIYTNISEFFHFIKAIIKRFD